MIEAVCVDPQKLDQVWKHCRHFIAGAYDRQPCNDTFERVERAVHDGSALLWLAWNGERILGAAVTEIWNNPARRICAIIACGGDQINSWLTACLPKIEAFAKAEQCECVHLEGRRGWSRVLKDYEQPWVTLEKKLK